MTIEKTGLKLIAAAVALLMALPAAFAEKAAPTKVAAKGTNGSARSEVARVRVVEGNVLLGQDNGLAAVEGIVEVPLGARVITTADSTASITFDDGCRFDLGPNQRLELVDSSKPCEERAVV